MRKVKITKTPQRKLKKFQGGGENKTGKSLSSVPRYQSNLEAEGGEFVVTPGMGGIPEGYNISGDKHSQGGVDMNLDTGSFIFSDHKSMKITDPDVLKKFDITGKKKVKKGVVPADIAKKYDLNDWIKVLHDPNSDRLEIETAEKMIENNTKKLSELALVQESIKGFEDGIPEMAIPALANYGISPEEANQMLSPMPQEQGQPQEGLSKFMYGGTKKERFQGQFWKSIMQQGGENPQQEFQSQYLINPETGEKYYTTMKENFMTLRNMGYITEQEAAQMQQQQETQPQMVHGGSVKRKIKITGKPKMQEGGGVEEEPQTRISLAQDTESSFGTGQLSGDVAERYKRLLTAFSDPKVVEAYANKVREAAKNEKYYKTKKGNTSELYGKLDVDNMSDDEIANLFLNHQQRNLGFVANNIDPQDFKDSNGQLKANLSKEKKDYYKSMGVNSLNDAAENVVGLPIPENKEGVGLEQLSYWGYKDLIEDVDNLPEEAKSTLKNYGLGKIGEEDEGQTGVKNISPIDGWYTNTTSGQDAVETLPPKQPKVIEEEPAEERKAIEANDVNYKRKPARDEWWLQDIVNMAGQAQRRANLKKYLPHESMPDFGDPDVVYEDPERALAANAEQVAMANQTIGSFAGSQGIYQLSGLAGEGTKNAANITADVHNRNINRNQAYLDKYFQNEKQENLYGAERRKRLHDGWTIANQQFDNAKAQSWAERDKALMSAIDNKMKAQALNQMYDQFEIKPGLGGGKFFKDPRQLNPGSSAPQGSGSMQPGSYIQGYEELKQKYPNASDTAIRRELDMQFGIYPGATHPNEM